jgi:hypothetical protein
MLIEWCMTSRRNRPRPSNGNNHMSQLPLLREAFAILKRNPVLWSAALIGLSIDFIASWIFVLAPTEFAILRTFLAFLLAAFTSGALISLVNALIDQQPVTLRDGLLAGLRYVWRLLALNLLLFVPVWILILFFSGSITAIFLSGLGQPGGIQATDVLTVLPSLFGLAGVVVGMNVLMSLIGIGADRSIVLAGEPVISALKSGWRLLAGNVRDYLSVGLLLLGVTVGVGLAFVFLLGPLLNSLAGGLTQPGAETTPTPAALFSPANVIFLLISLVVNSFFTAFASSVWTLAYRQWRGE